MIGTHSINRNEEFSGQTLTEIFPRGSEHQLSEKSMVLRHPSFSFQSLNRNFIYLCSTNNWELRLENKRKTIVSNLSRTTKIINFTNFCKSNGNELTKIKENNHLATLKIESGNYNFLDFAERKERYSHRCTCA